MFIARSGVHMPVRLILRGYNIESLRVVEDARVYSRQLIQTEPVSLPVISVKVI